jgi:hypothetical protein
LHATTQEIEKAKKRCLRSGNHDDDDDDVLLLLIDSQLLPIWSLLLRPPLTALCPATSDRYMYMYMIGGLNLTTVV